MGVALGSDVEYEWTTGPTGTTYGLMGDVLGAVEYEDIINIPQTEYDDTMSKPLMYDTSIIAATSDYQRDKKSKIRDELVRWWYVRKGFHRGMRENFMDALDKTYYEQLEHDITGYQEVNTGDFFTHLKSV